MPQYRRQKGPLLIKGNLYVTGTVTPSYVPVGGHSMPTEAEGGAAPTQVGSDVAVEPALVHPDAAAPAPQPAAPAPHAPAPHAPAHPTHAAPPPKKK